MIIITHIKPRKWQSSAGKFLKDYEQDFAQEIRKVFEYQDFSAKIEVK